MLALSNNTSTVRRRPPLKLPPPLKMNLKHPVLDRRKSNPQLFKKGNKANPWGRKGKNGQGVATGRLIQQKRREWLAKNGTLSPLEFFLGVMRDIDTHMDYRLEAAKCAAPYVHRKMPIAIEGGDPNKPVVFEASALAMLQPQEKMLLLALVEKMTLALGPKAGPKALIEAVAKREADSDDDSDGENK